MDCPADRTGRGREGSSRGFAGAARIGVAALQRDDGAGVRADETRRQVVAVRELRAADRLRAKGPTTDDRRITRGGHAAAARARLESRSPGLRRTAGRNQPPGTALKNGSWNASRLRRKSVQLVLATRASAIRGASGSRPAAAAATGDVCRRRPPPRRRAGTSRRFTARIARDAGEGDDVESVETVAPAAEAVGKAATRTAPPAGKVDEGGVRHQARTHAPQLSVTALKSRSPAG